MPGGALEGYVVIDASDGLPGAYCTKLLAGLGAEVISIEPPERGNSLRNVPPFKDDLPNVETSTTHLHFDMAKKSVTLDLETEAGRDVLRRLLQTADILVESWPLGWAEQHGL